VSREAKTGIGLAIVAFLALAAYRSMSTVVALGVLIIGIATVVVMLRRSAEGGEGRPRRKQSTTELLEQATNDIQPLRTWSPPESLQPWSPPAGPPSSEPAPPTSEFAPTVDDVTSTDSAPTDDFWAPSTQAEPSDFSDLAPDRGTTSWLDDPFGKTDDAFTPVEDEPATDRFAPVTDEPFTDAGNDGWADGSTWSGAGVASDTNPLDELKRLDEVDVIAEFERLETHDTLTEPELAVEAPILDELAVPINEDVSSADDILAASQATELQVTADGENSELAKLLAKVQARLAAYE
jgi:hypothetical protein